jgi:predicted nuclease of predicted toxin-antitoxin system
MKILLDEHLSHRLRPLLVGHDVFSVKFMGWRGVSNGELLARAAAAGFEVLLTMDAGIPYEQNLSSLPCSVVVLKATSTAVEHISPLIPKLLAALPTLAPRSFLRVE